MKATDFSSGVMNRYEVLTNTVAKSSTPLQGYRSRAPSRAKREGHPAFDELDVGQTATCNLAVAFLDMRAMTARSFWEPLTDVTRLSLAVLGQVAEVVQESGGYVLGMRGDGLMAGWGDHKSDRAVDMAMAMAACAFSLDAVENSLNEMLRHDGIEPVQLCAGADHGEVCFTRTGTAESSEVNIVGHPANFAAKCEHHANSWEVVVGEGAGKLIHPRLLARHAKSPRKYEYRGKRRTYAFHQFAWRQIVGPAAGAIAQVAGEPTSSIDPHWKEILQ